MSFLQRPIFFISGRICIWPVWPDYLEKSWQHSCMGKLQIKSNILVFGFCLTFSMDDRCMMGYIHNFFISFEANLSEYGSSLLHIRMFQYLQTSFNHIAPQRDHCKRAILFFSSSKILTPHPPLRPASLSVHTRRAERGMGGQYFGRREKKDCPLTMISLPIARFILAAKYLHKFAYKYLI